MWLLEDNRKFEYWVDFFNDIKELLFSDNGIMVILKKVSLSVRDTHWNIYE